MRILLCHNYYQQSGGEDQVFAAEAELLKAAGHAVHEFSVHNDAIRDMSRLAVMRKTMWNHDSARRVSAIIQEFQPTVMHCHNVFPLLSPSIYHAVAEAGVAVVQTLHNYRLLCPGSLFLRDGKPCELCLHKRIAWPSVVHGCYRNDRAATAVVAGMLAYHRHRRTWSEAVDHYIALTQFAKDKFVAGGFDSAQITVKPNFLQNDPGPKPGHARRAVFVGRLSPEKGLVTLIDAWKRLREPIQLTIVGDGPLADLVKQAALKDSRIEWLGRRTPEEVYDVVGHSACLIMPSVWYETFGCTIIEAFAVGTPVIASRLGAMAEIVDAGEDGALFEPGNAESLVAAVQTFFSEPSDFARKRQAARSKFVAKYSAAVNYPQLIEVYRAAVAMATEKRRRGRR